MKVQKMIQVISSLDKTKQQELGELYGMINVLYKQYGQKLSQKEVTDSIRAQSPDIAMLIEQLVRDGGLEQLPLIIQYFQNHADKVTLEVTTPKEYGDIESKLHHVVNGAHIHTHQSEKLGVKVKSTAGQSYERTLNKDIDKLIQ